MQIKEKANHTIGVAFIVSNILLKNRLQAEADLYGFCISRLIGYKELPLIGIDLTITFAIYAATFCWNSITNRCTKNLTTS